jgi:hypothetical protein
MIVIANPEPIALSIVEGCAQSPRSNVLQIGIVEGWNDGLMRSKPKLPIFPYSITPFPSYASLEWSETHIYQQRRLRSK